MKTVNPVSIRIPNELKHWAENRSIRNYRSLSSEVIAILASARNDELQIKSMGKQSGPSSIATVTTELIAENALQDKNEETADV